MHQWVNQMKVANKFLMSILMYVSQSSGTVHKQQLSPISRDQADVRKHVVTINLREEAVVFVCMTCSFKMQLAKCLFYIRNYHLHLCGRFISAS